MNVRKIAALFGVACLLSLFFPSPPGWAGQLPPLVLSSEITRAVSPVHLAILEDQRGTLSLGDVMAPANGSRFTPISPEETHAGLTTSTFWIRFVVANNSEIRVDWVLTAADPRFHLFDVTVFHGKGGKTTYSSHALKENSGDPLPYRLFAYPFSTGPYTQDVVYVRKQYFGLSPMNLETPILIRSAFESRVRSESWVYGGYFGGLLVLALYNLSLFVSIRDRVFTFYLLYLFSIAFLNLGLTGLGSQYVWPGVRPLEYFASVTAGALSIIFLTQFTRKILQMERWSPKGYRVFGWYTWLAVFWLAINLIGIMVWPHVEMRAAVWSLSAYVGYFVLLMSLFLPIAGFWAWSAGVKSARFYIAGWSIMITSAALYLLGDAGLISHTLYTAHGPLWGSWLEMIFFSFAIGDRIATLAKEKEAAEVRHRLAAEKNNETLELKVEERTAELLVEREKAVEANRLKDQIVTLVSHDMRSPLGAVNATLEQMRDQSSHNLSDKAQEMLARCIGATSGLLAMIEKLLDINRLRSWKVLVDRRIAPTEELVQSALTPFNERAADKNITFHMDIPEGHALFADPTLIGEVIHNLLDNAIKYSDASSSIWIEARGSESPVLVVRDEGCGIKPKLIDHLFTNEKLTTTPGARGERGYGFGLPVSREIMRAHGGDLTVESEPGTGSAFLCLFPPRRPLVMVVDDLDTARANIIEILSMQHEIDCMEASNGADGLERMAIEAPRLIITDIHMPGVTGLDLLTQVKASPRLQTTPVMVVTSDADPHTRELALRLGADDFALKPISVDDFLPRVKRFLDKR